MSPANDENYDLAVQIARVILKKHQMPQKEDLKNAVASAAKLYPDVDTKRLIEELETLYNVFTPDGTILTDPTDHDEWAAERRAAMRGDFWKRYELYLEQEKQFPPQVLTRLDSLTDRTLSLLEDPQRPGEWDRRGMVVGQVQSGKTANYTGLICKAADAGYKLIIILAGIHNSLRSQTQLRLDEGFRGIDSKQDRVFTLDSPRIGVGKIQMPPGSKIAAHSLTTSDERGDFKKTTAKAVATYIGNDPVILVIKKNGSILKNLLQWIKSSHVAEQHNGEKIVRNIPLLLLDDEADNASINTKLLEESANRKFKTKQDVTRINALIRQLLQTFSKSAYVGYTATPFANIFIPHDVKTEDEGEDLFPRSFIINLPAPSNYIGPTRVFGLSAQNSETTDGLPIIRRVTDSEMHLPGQHLITLSPTALPDSLKEAIRAFILTCAARRARGQVKVHNSMLIHVTRFVGVQSIVKDLVEQEFNGLRRRIENGDGARTPTIRQELRELWERDFVPTTESVGRQLPEDQNLTSLTWEEIEPHLALAVGPVEVKQINGTAKDVLDYYDHKDGHSVIAIGGDKLSRGLTLEGLSVSYYLRASRMYDTLMQMGRWFGYRPGYADLCRLYTTPELEDWYKHITIASEELREDFDVMAAQGLTPEQYGLKVRTHPGGLTVTSAGKLRYGTAVRVSFSGQLVETSHLSKSAADIEHNFTVTDDFITHLGQFSRRNHSQSYIWEGVSADKIIVYLDALNENKNVPEHTSSQPANLAKYIKIKNKKNELDEWTVALINSSIADRKEVVGGWEVGLLSRTPGKGSNDKIYILIKSHIVSPSDEWIDLLPEEIEEATAKRNEVEPQQNSNAPKTFKEPNGRSVRAVRSKKRGLLLIYPLDPTASGKDESDSAKTVSIFPDDDPRRNGKPIVGFAISFPGGNSREDLEDAVEYVVNRVYIKEELEGAWQEEELNDNAD